MKFIEEVFEIKIYSYWNVNITSEDSEKTVYGIKIYSYWNVNSVNGWSSSGDIHIKIYSYWNVNIVKSFMVIKLVALKSTHTEM